MQNAPECQDPVTTRQDRGETSRTSPPRCSRPSCPAGPSGIPDERPLALLPEHGKDLRPTITSMRASAAASSGLRASRPEVRDRPSRVQEEGTRVLLVWLPVRCRAQPGVGSCGPGRRGLDDDAAMSGAGDAADEAGAPGVAGDSVWSRRLIGGVVLPPGLRLEPTGRQGGTFAASLHRRLR